MPEVHPRFIDPATGLIRPVAEYQRDFPRQQSADMQDARPHWFDADGNKKSNLQIDAEAAIAQRAKEFVTQEVRARSHREPTADEKLIQNLSMLISSREQATKYLNADARRQEMEYIDTLKARRTEVESKQAEELRVQRFQESEAFQRVKTHSEAFRRTPPEGADPQALAMALAIADNSSEFQDSNEYSRHYFGEVAKVQEAAYLAAIDARESKRLEANRLESEAATADVTAAEAALRLVQAAALANE